jgi:hypothetical protein
MSLQYFDGKQWLNVLPDFTSQGTGLTLPFHPVVAQKFRLTIQNEKQAPAINEFILFRAE